jgi:hypothetical protein
MTTDQTVLNHIEKLVSEEEALYAHGDPSIADRQRLGVINVELDRCWDLLRQRRARREFGEDPEDAKIRPASVVENYKDE